MGIDVLQPQTLEASVFLKPNPLSQYVKCSEIRAVDRQLGYLFDYLTSHYEEDEYIALLRSRSVGACAQSVSLE